MYCKPQIVFDQNGGKVTVMAGPKACGGKTVEDVVITIPFPQSVSSANLSATHGNVHYDELTKVKIVIQIRL